MQASSIFYRSQLRLLKKNIVFETPVNVVDAMIPNMRFNTVLVLIFHSQTHQKTV